MKDFQSYITEGAEAELIGLLKSFGAGDITVNGDHLITRLSKKQQVWDIVERLPAGVDYDVMVFELNDNGKRELVSTEVDYPENEIGYENLDDNYHEYKLIVYLFNAEMSEVEPAEMVGESAEELAERKRIVKVNAKGERRIKIKCKKGYKYAGGKCVKISGKEMTDKKRAIRKAVRTKKNKGAGFTRRVSRLRKRAQKKRSNMGLKSGHVPTGNPITENQSDKKIVWMETYKQEMGDDINLDTALHYYYTGIDAKTAAKASTKAIKG